MYTESHPVRFFPRHYSLIGLRNDGQRIPITRHWAFIFARSIADRGKRPTQQLHSLLVYFFGVYFIPTEQEEQMQQHGGKRTATQT